MVKNRSIMVVSPDENTRFHIEDLVSQLGVRTCVVSNGRNGLNKIDEYDVDIIFVDLNLEDFEPNEYCKTLRKMYGNRPLQILILVDGEKHKDINSVLKSGANDFILSPYRVQELEMRFRAALLRYNSQQNLFHERNFYRRAVKKEEELSSKILDQNIHLKRAYESIEVMNKELEREKTELLRVSKYDVLSGMFNRMSIFSLIDVEIERAIRSDIPLSGIMLDIDHFKVINDTFGHQFGDKVIAEIGKCLRKGLRKYDHAGRYGGEEFFVVLPNTSLEQAVQIAERFRNDLRHRKMPSPVADSEIKITGSFGVAQFQFGESRENWIERADKAMYKAKQNGRNQVISEE